MYAKSRYSKIGKERGRSVDQRPIVSSLRALSPRSCRASCGRRPRPDTVRAASRAGALGIGRLERERERLERDLAAAQSRDVTSPGGIEEIVKELVAALASLREVLESGEAEERKAVVRTFLRGVTINRKAGQATLTWFRLPAIQNVGLKVGGAEGC